MQKKKIYQDINIIRVLACIAVLFYHFNILQGGFLAVSIFFVLSGYLSCKSACNEKKFSFLSYYSNRFLKLYLPFVIIIFLTLGVVSLFPNNWMNLKPETTSSLLGYNNFWQINANLDYFARHVSSPFMHFWYIAILIQFDIVFPFFYVIFRKLGDKIHKSIPCLLGGLLTIIFGIYFYKSSLNQNIMITYYHTLTRLFPLILGATLGFIHFYYKPLVFPKLKEKKYQKIVFSMYILILCLFFLFINSKSSYFAISLIMTSLISCRLIDYGTIFSKKKLSSFDKIINFFSAISYEIYLVQYPIIYLFQFVEIPSYFKIILILVITIIISIIIHFILFSKERNNHKFIRILFSVVVISLSIFGLFHYITSIDHTKEMKELEKQLFENEKKFEEKQKEYEEHLKQEDDEWLSILENLEKDEDAIKDVVHNLSLVGVGDSVMLGAVENLYKEFPNGYFDAKVSRTAWKVNEILVDLKKKNMLGNPIILNLGANGDCSLSCKKEIMKTVEDREVFWINVTNDKDVHVNGRLKDLAKDYNNLHIIDWASISKGHSEYFVSDGIHLTRVGRENYTKAIYDAIYQVYLKEYDAKKEEILKEHEQKQKSKITFYGNTLLLNAFDSIHSNFEDANFIIQKDFTYDKLKQEIKKSIKEETLNYNIIFAFDNKIKISLEEYKELLSICKDYNVYIISMDKDISKNLEDSLKNVIFIKFYEELEQNQDYIMKDGIHLTEVGNKALSEILKDKILGEKN